MPPSVTAKRSGADVADSAAVPDATLWPTMTLESRPWTRWWWFGSAVNEAEITRRAGTAPGRGGRRPAQRGHGRGCRWAGPRRSAAGTATPPPDGGAGWCRRIMHPICALWNLCCLTGPWYSVPQLRAIPSRSRDDVGGPVGIQAGDEIDGDANDRRHRPWRNYCSW